MVTYASEKERNELTEMINSIPKYHLFKVEKIGKKYVTGFLKFIGQKEQCQCKICIDDARQYLDLKSNEFQRIPKNIHKFDIGNWI